MPAFDVDLLRWPGLASPERHNTFGGHERCGQGDGGDEATEGPPIMHGKPEGIVVLGYHGNGDQNGNRDHANP